MVVMVRLFAASLPLFVLSLKFVNITVLVMIVKAVRISLINVSMSRLVQPKTDFWWPVFTASPISIAKGAKAWWDGRMRKLTNSAKSIRRESLLLKRSTWTWKKVTTSMCVTLPENEATDGENEQWAGGVQVLWSLLLVLQRMPPPAETLTISLTARIRHQFYVDIGNHKLQRLLLSVRLRSLRMIATMH